MVLRPTFEQLALNDLAQVSSAMETIVLEAAALAATQNSPENNNQAVQNEQLQEVNVVIQESEWSDPAVLLSQGETLKLPNTTLTFVILGTFASSTTSSNDEKQVILNTLILNTFAKPSIQSELRSRLETVDSLRDLVDATVTPASPLSSHTLSPRSSNNNAGNPNAVDIVLLSMSGLVLLAVAYLLYHSVTKNHRQARDQQQQQQQDAARLAALRRQQQQYWLDKDDGEEDNSMCNKLHESRSGAMDMFSILKPKNSSSAQPALDATPKATEEEEDDSEASDVDESPKRTVTATIHTTTNIDDNVEKVDSDESWQTPSAESSQQSAPSAVFESSGSSTTTSSSSSGCLGRDVPQAFVPDFASCASSTSSGAANITTTSSEEISQEGLSHLCSSDSSCSSSSSSSRSGVNKSDSDDHSCHEDASLEDSYASSGISSANFSTSRWFHPKTATTVTTNHGQDDDDDEDVFHVDVEKAQQDLHCDNSSKATASTASMLEWARTLQVIPSVSSTSVATPECAYMTPCSNDTASSSGGSSHDASEHEENAVTV